MLLCDELYNKPVIALAWRAITNTLLNGSEIIIGLSNELERKGIYGIMGVVTARIRPRPRQYGYENHQDHLHEEINNY